MNKHKILQFFYKYPIDSLIRPQLWKNLSLLTKKKNSKESLVTIQSTPNKFYYLLFGLIINDIRSHVNLKTQLITVRAISGSIGTNWLAYLKRWSLVNWLITSQWERAYGDMVHGIAYRSSTFLNPLSDFKDWLKSKSLWQTLKKQNDNFTLKINNIEYSDLIIDSYLRFKPSPKFNKDDSFVRYIIWQTLRDSRQAHYYFSTAKPKLYLSSYSSYIEHGVAARVATQYDVSVWTFGSLTSFGKLLTPFDTYHAYADLQYKTRFESLDDQSKCLAEAKVELEKRLHGEIDIATSYMKKSAYSNKEEPLNLQLKDSVIVFLHDFYDSPHVYNNFIFCDFWQWACFTIESLQETGISFYLKAHPNQIPLNQQVLIDLSSRYPSINWIPSETNNTQLVNAGIICGITAYGTVAHELAYMGIPSICCSDHPHLSFNFCRTAKNRDEYKNMLRDPSLCTISKEEMQQQALIFYYMRNLYKTKEEKNLELAVVKLWNLCNLETSTDSEIIDAMTDLSRQHEFKKFTSMLSETINRI